MRGENSFTTDGWFDKLTTTHGLTQIRNTDVRSIRVYLSFPPKIPFAFFRKCGYVVITLLSLGIHADENEVTGNYPQIRELLRQNNTGGAQREISRLIAKNENDPTLSLFQTEVWIQIGERNFNNGNYKTAYEYFRRANNFWPNHPLVQMRYKDLKKRSFRDVALESNLKKPEIVEVRSFSDLKDSGKRIIYVLDSGNNSDELKQILSEIKADLKMIRENKNGADSSGTSVSSSISKGVFWPVVGFFGMAIGGLGFVVFRKKSRK